MLVCFPTYPLCVYLPLLPDLEPGEGDEAVLQEGQPYEAQADEDIYYQRIEGQIGGAWRISPCQGKGYL